MKNQEVKNLLKDYFENSKIKVKTREEEDENAKHFKVFIKSKEFEGLSKLERRKLVYDALGDTIKNEIHAIEIDAVAPEEAKK